VNDYLKCVSNLIWMFCVIYLYDYILNKLI
jgi:hypothetical protein